VTYYGYRYYSPVLGRWTRRDPIDLGRNFYHFVKNGTPFRYDILGLQTNDKYRDEKEKKCNDEKNKFWKNNPRWEEIRNWYKTNPSKESKRKKCEVRLKCVCCGDNQDFGGRTRLAYTKDGTLIYESAVCYNKSSNYTQTIAHELTHFFDYCGGEYDDSNCPDKDANSEEHFKCHCYNKLCMEYRAFFITGKCHDPDSCWEYIMTKHFAKGTKSYWEDYSCDLLVGKSQLILEKMKLRLETKCSLNHHMPPPPIYPKPTL
jgi:hypothetical protein